MSVKKVTIEKKDLPPLSPNGEYLLRYRIISEDKNRTSHWSPVYKLDATRVWDEEGEEFVSLIKPVSGDLQINSASGVTAIWGDTNLKSLYDIFVSFGTYNPGTSTIAWQEYFYHGSSPVHTYSFLKQEVHTDIRVKIQLAGIEKVVNNVLTICSLEATSR